MQISVSLLLFFLSSFSPIQGFAPSPAPGPDPSFKSVQGFNFPPSPESSADSPAPAPAIVEEGSEKSGGVVPSGPVAEPEDDAGSETLNLKWCTVREEFDDCQDFVNALDQSDEYTWKCVERDTTQECLESIRKGEADMINVEAGLAYAAFLNYSMKAIANEVYCGHAQSFDAVAVVNRKACLDNERLGLMDFKGHKSCNGGYSTATGWNYPINHIKESSIFDLKRMNDREIASGFFADVCAPSEFEGVNVGGMCSGCGNENGSCHSSSMYYSGHSGAFRCLVEEMGDIAFVRGDTALLYSMEGPHNQSWSTKSIRDFMYLCPQGGCREINGYSGSCSFGTVPANVIMASNSIPNTKRLFILQTLTNATRMNDALYAGKNGASYLLSPSTQELVAVKKLTRSYLGKSASISQSIQEVNKDETQANPSTQNAESGTSSCSSSLFFFGEDSNISLSYIVYIIADLLTLPALKSSYAVEFDVDYGGGEGFVGVTKPDTVDGVRSSHRVAGHHARMYPSRGHKNL
ncbi:hypothetical protein EZV62_025429 [Acer yangbiense]|uniref:Transferrin-like domain-containing protein n=1 Tax=Acer yangbiense TaxID=1000413 RepID=A0A5C7GXS6_9ROSI|nr:hypothetical protein EZV62_025429 [Acer yangbiense]